MEVTGNRRKGEMEVTGNIRKGEIEIHEEEQRRENRIKMNQKAPKLKRGQIQCKPENSEIGRRLYSNIHVKLLHSKQC